MTRTEFEKLQLKQASSGMSLQAFLKEGGIAYTTYNYWWRKIKRESVDLPIATISLHHSEPHWQPHNRAPPNVQELESLSPSPTE